jgi:hypothetical protein
LLSARKIAVIGGTGVVGSIVARELSEHFPNSRVTIASRSAAASASTDRVVHQAVDVNDPDALQSLLADMDVAVVATGPFEQFGAIIHRACIDAGVDVVDINDSASAAAAIMETDAGARAKGVRILTGMGLAPGLSTLLLCRLAARVGFKPERAMARLYMGARNSGGPSNAGVLLSGFKRRLPTIEDGKTCTGPAQWSGPDARYQFPGSGRALRLLPFASPEMITLPATGQARRLGVTSLDWRYHVQFLPPGLGRLLAVSGLTASHRAIARLSRSFHRSGVRMRQRKDADDTTTLVIALADGSNALAVHGPVATGHLTAMMAVGATAYLLGPGRELAPGVYPFERLHAEDPAAEQTIDTWLARRGIVVVDPSVPSGGIHRVVFGDSATFDGTAPSLRNYGKCWYTAGPIPPRVKAYQQACLRGSALWKAVCERTSWAGRAKIFMRMYRRHVRLRRSAERQDFGLLGAAPINAEIIKDFSLFAAGFGEARDLIGDDALRLYTEMFLDSGAMEMAWLWPSTRVFAGADDPARTLTDYVEAYVEASTALGVMVASFKRQQQGFEVEVGRCRYAEILAALGCAELGGLVREMEVRAIRDLAVACHLEASWNPGSADGAGKLVIAPPRPASVASSALSEAAQ